MLRVVPSRSGRWYFLFDYHLLKIEVMHTFCFCQIEHSSSGFRSRPVQRLLKRGYKFKGFYKVGWES